MKAPRVSTYRGMIFASFAETGESLEEHFGPLRKYIDYWFDHSPVGRVTLSRPYRAVYHGNWKFQAENSTDGWHARYVHESALQMLERFGDRSRAVGWTGCTRGFAHGHGVLELERTGDTGCLLRSRDSGQTWEPIYLTPEPNSSMWTVAVHEADPNLMYANSLFGYLYRSDDGGESCEKLRRELSEIRSLIWIPG
jgi:phenylpropionate dioxygenase-like ring-hydroxylating dioxygenase large terminal subunit